MTDAKHSIHMDITRKLLTIKCFGFWSLDDVHDYDRAQGAALRSMAKQGCPPDEVRVLIDCSEHMPQALEVISELDKVLSHGSKTGKVAVLVSSTLLARQSGRTGPEHRVFYNEREALDWVLS